MAFFGLDDDFAVDIRRIGHGAANDGATADIIDNDRLRGANFRTQFFGADCLLSLHEFVPAFFFHIFGHMSGNVIGRRPFDRFLFETTDAFQLYFIQPIQQDLKIFVRLAGEANNKRRTHG